MQILLYRDPIFGNTAICRMSWPFNVKNDDNRTTDDLKFTALVRFLHPPFLHPPFSSVQSSKPWKWYSYVIIKPAAGRSPMQELLIAISALASPVEKGYSLHLQRARNCGRLEKELVLRQQIWQKRLHLRCRLHLSIGYYRIQILRMHKASVNHRYTVNPSHVRVQVC